MLSGVRIRCFSQIKSSKVKILIAETKTFFLWIFFRHQKTKFRIFLNHFDVFTFAERIKTLWNKNELALPNSKTSLLLLLTITSSVNTIFFFNNRFFRYSKIFLANLLCCFGFAFIIVREKRSRDGPDIRKNGKNLLKVDSFIFAQI